MKIVISRYNESLDWTTGLNNCIIYNKGDTIESVHPVITLPNVGREGHTYLHHIITNYDVLDDYTIFLQGNPFDHTPYLESILPSSEWKKPFHVMSRNVFHMEINEEHNAYNMLSLYHTIFNRTTPSFSLWFGAGAQFCVSRETIRSRPKAFYEQIYIILGAEVNPIAGHAVERFWPMIFLGESLEERAA
jgi:hypothetical protein